VYVELNMVPKEGTYCDEELMNKQFKVNLCVTLVRIYQWCYQCTF